MPLPNEPQTYVPTQFTPMAASANFYWNGSAWVAGGGPGPTGDWSFVPGPVTLVALAISVVTSAGVAVQALAAGQKTRGGWIKNPVTATVDLGINEIGTASGTTSAGSTTFISPGETYVLAPSAGAVSVIAADAAHAFSGMGWI